LGWFELVYDKLYRKAYYYFATVVRRVVCITAEVIGACGQYSFGSFEVSHFESRNY